MGQDPERQAGRQTAKDDGGVYSWASKGVDEEGGNQDIICVKAVFLVKDHWRDDYVQQRCLHA